VPGEAYLHSCLSDTATFLVATVHLVCSSASSPHYLPICLDAYLHACIGTPTPPPHPHTHTLTLPVPGGPCHRVTVLVSASSIAVPWLRFMTDPPSTRAFTSALACRRRFWPLGVLTHGGVLRHSAS
jgi:hypothetical protein